MNKEKLARALKEWKEEATEGDWPDRSDENQYSDAAQYLLDKMSSYG